MGEPTGGIPLKWIIDQTIPFATLCRVALLSDSEQLHLYCGDDLSRKKDHHDETGIRRGTAWKSLKYTFFNASSSDLILKDPLPALLSVAYFEIINEFLIKNSVSC